MLGFRGQALEPDSLGSNPDFTTHYDGLIVFSQKKKKKNVLRSQPPGPQKMTLSGNNVLVDVFS